MRHTDLLHTVWRRLLEAHAGLDPPDEGGVVHPEVDAGLPRQDPGVVLDGPDLEAPLGLEGLEDLQAAGGGEVDPHLPPDEHQTRHEPGGCSEGGVAPHAEAQVVRPGHEGRALDTERPALAGQPAGAEHELPAEDVPALGVEAGHPDQERTLDGGRVALVALGPSGTRGAGGPSGTRGAGGAGGLGGILEGLEALAVRVQHQVGAGGAGGATGGGGVVAGVQALLDLLLDLGRCALGSGDLGGMGGRPPLHADLVGLAREGHAGGLGLLREGGGGEEEGEEGDEIGHLDVPSRRGMRRRGGGLGGETGKTRVEGLSKGEISMHAVEEHARTTSRLWKSSLSGTGNHSKNMKKSQFIPLATVMIRYPQRPFYTPQDIKYMALTKNDLQLLREMFIAQDARFNVALHQQRSELRSAIDQQTQDIKRDIRDEMDARFVASETKMERLFQHELQAVIDILLTFVPERFERLEQNVLCLKTHTGLT